MRHVAQLWVLTFVILGAILSSACAQCDLKQPFQVSVKESGGHCMAVMFPEPWRFSSYPHPSYFIFRRGSDGRYLVAAEAPLEISLNKCLLRIENSAKAEPATEDEWRQAQEVRWARSSQVFGEQWEKATASGILEYAGKQYHRPGDYWMSAQSALPSPAGTWLALQGMNGNVSKDDRGAGPQSGTVFTEVFRTSNGEKAFTITARFCDWSASSYYNNVGWISDRHLMIRGSLDDRLMIICDLDSH